jgi:hypothetical protein
VRSDYPHPLLAADMSSNDRCEERRDETCSGLFSCVSGDVGRGDGDGDVTNSENDSTDGSGDDEGNTGVTVITVRASGDQGTENIELKINDQTLATWENINTTPTDYTITTTETITIETLQLHFTNDAGWPNQDRNVTIDHIKINNTTYETEDPNTLSTGTWTSDIGCDHGNKTSERLQCDGYLQYNAATGHHINQPTNTNSENDSTDGSDTTQPPVTDTTIPSGTTDTTVPSTTPHTGGDGSGNDDAGSDGTVSGGDKASYDGNLQAILDSTVRNRNEDNSPYINTPTEDLYDRADLYGDPSDYQVPQGSYNSDRWIEAGLFRGNGAGTFRAECEASHFAYDDPIVFPGQPEASHLHMFIGNTHANAHSTFDTILNSGGSTCNGGELNRTAYWVPAMFDGTGNVVVPSKIRFYYKTEMPAGIGNVETYPDDLQLVADTENNVQTNVHLSTFRCNSMFNGAKSTPSATIPSCASPTSNGQPGAVEFMIFFDHCWNGETSTAGDWEANRDTNFVAPSRYWHSSVCPASHPQLLPALVTHIFYDVRPGEDTSKWFMASDVNATTGRLESPGGTFAHADWFGGWNPEVNQEWVDNCSNVQGAECGYGLLADPLNDSSARSLRLRNDYIAGYNSDHARIPVEDIYEQLCSIDADLDTANGAAAGAFCRPGSEGHSLHPTG